MRFPHHWFVPTGCASLGYSFDAPSHRIMPDPPVPVGSAVCEVGNGQAPKKGAPVVAALRFGRAVRRRPAARVRRRLRADRPSVLRRWQAQLPVLRALLGSVVALVVSLHTAAAHAFDDPVAFIGHGALFDADGKEIAVTAEQLIDWQTQYRDALLRAAGDEARARHDEADRRLGELVERLDTYAARDRSLFLARARTALIQGLTRDVAEPPFNLGHARLVSRLIERSLFPAGNAPALPEALQVFIDELTREQTPSDDAVLFSTFNTGAAYIAECAANGVPIPPDWGSSQWVATGTLTNEFISGGLEARPHAFSAPEGTCIALPRDDGSDIRLLGIICLGKQTSKVCFWDNQQNDVGFDIPLGDSVPLSGFAGGAELKDGTGGICTTCHAGENPFVMHPGTPLGNPALGAFATMGDDWYDPLVHPDWPQNAGPSVLVPTLPGIGACTACHVQGNAGRFPHLSATINQGGNSYCAAVLNNAVTQTMPPGAEGSQAGDAHVAAMQALCANLAEPIQRIEAEVIDFGEVELGFSYAKALVVHNDGDANLTLTVNRVTPLGDPDLAHFDEVNELAATTIAPGDPPIVLRQVYEPTAVGAHTVELQVVSDDASAPATSILLTGEGVMPRPIDSVLVLDRSGSMDDPAGDRRKIEAMRDAVQLYTDLMRETAGDRLGFVRYNQANDVYFPLTAITNAVKNALELSELSASAINDLNRLRPDGTTGIGGAMMTAADEVGGPAADRGSVVVVLTDGKENEEPNIAAGIADIAANHGHVQMYSVGLGFDIEPTKLQDITNMGDEGYHQVTNTLSDETLFDLEAFYFKIFASAANMDMVTDPTHIVNLASGASVIVDRATVISSDRNATFLVLDDPQMRAFYDLAFIAPDGQVLKPGVDIGGIPIQEQVRANHRIYRVVFPDPSQADTYVGDWILQLTPNGRWSGRAGKVAQAESQFDYQGQMQPFQGRVPVGFAGAVSSNYRLATVVTTTGFLPGATLKLDATLTDRGWPAPDGQVTVTVTRPDGVVHSVTLHDDGAHGDGAATDATWSNSYAQTAPAGVYRLLFRSIGRNERGELAPRLAERYVTLARPEPPFVDPDGGDGPGHGCRGCENSAASYLIGSFDLGDGGRSLLDVMNPTARTLEFVVSLFDRDGKPLQCVRDRIAANGLRTLDLRRLDPQRSGLVKVVAFEPGTRTPAYGLVGNQRQQGGPGIENTGLHPISPEILRRDLDRILEICR